MRNFAILSLVVLVAAALAGCASNGSAPTDNMTMTPTATMTPSATPSAGGMDMGGHPDCAPSPTSGAATSTLTVGVREPPAGSNETSADHCFGLVGLHNVTAGLVNITFHNNGTMPHVLVVQRVTGNHTLEDVMHAFMSSDESSPQPDWIQDWGGPSLLDPQLTSSVVQDMPEGDYLVFCWFNGHIGMGMVGWISAVPGNSTVTAPTADTTLTLTNFGYAFSHNLTAGHHVVAVHNNGTQAHETPFIALEGNATVMEFADAVENPNATSPPPGHAIAGVNAIQPGQTVYVDITVEKGPHGLICFVTDPATGKPHALLGMHLDFVVA